MKTRTCRATVFLLLALAGTLLFHPSAAGVAPPPPAAIGNIKYESVTAAIGAATEGQVILIQADVQENLLIPAGKTITLDLQGHSIANAPGGGPTIENRGSLTLRSSGPAAGTLCNGTKADVISNRGSLALTHINLTEGLGWAISSTAAARLETMTDCSVRTNRGLNFSGGAGAGILTNLEITTAGTCINLELKTGEIGPASIDKIEGCRLERTNLMPGALVLISKGPGQSITVGEIIRSELRAKGDAVLLKAWSAGAVSQLGLLRDTRVQSSDGSAISDRTRTTEAGTKVLGELTGSTKLIGEGGYAIDKNISVLKVSSGGFKGKTALFAMPEKLKFAANTCVTHRFKDSEGCNYTAAIAHYVTFAGIGDELPSVVGVADGDSVVYPGSVPVKDEKGQLYCFEHWATEPGGKVPADLLQITASQTLYPSYDGGRLMRREGTASPMTATEIPGHETAYKSADSLDLFTDSGLKITLPKGAPSLNFSYELSAGATGKLCLKIDGALDGSFGEKTGATDWTGYTCRFADKQSAHTVELIYRMGDKPATPTDRCMVADFAVQSSLLIAPTAGNAGTATATAPDTGLEVGKTSLNAVSGDKSIRKTQLTMGPALVASMDLATELEVKTDAAAVTLDRLALREIKTGAVGGGVELFLGTLLPEELNPAQKAAAAEAVTIVDLRLTQGPKVLTLGPGLATVTFDYMRADSTGKRTPHVYHLGPGGEKTKLPALAEHGQLRVQTDHCGTFFVTEELGPLAQYTLSVKTDAEHYNPGDMISADLVATAPVDTAFGSCGFTLAYDPARLELLELKTAIPGQSAINGGSFAYIISGSTPVPVGPAGTVVAEAKLRVRADISGGASTLGLERAKLTYQGLDSNPSPTTLVSKTVGLHNIIVRFGPGSGGSLPPQSGTAYGKYDHVGLWEDVTYGRAFTFPQPAANPGYRLGDKPWGDGQSAYTTAQLEALRWTESKSLVVQTVKTAQVSFACGSGGSMAPGAAVTVDAGTALSALILPQLLADPGHEFTGWYAGEQRVDAETYLISGDLVLTAKFAPGTFALTGPQADLATLVPVSGIADGRMTYGRDGVFTLTAGVNQIICRVSYQVGNVPEVLLTAAGDRYTIPGAAVTGALRIRVETLAGSLRFIEAADYKVMAADQRMLVLKTAKLTGEKYTLADGAALYWSSKYGAYVCFVARDKSELALTEALIRVPGAATEIAYDGNLNGMDGTEAEDGGILNDMLHNQRLVPTTDLQRFEADMNFDGSVTTADILLVLNAAVGK